MCSFLAHLQISLMCFYVIYIIYCILYCVFNCDLQGLVFEQFTVNMMNLMRSILRCEAYTPAKTLEGQIILLCVVQVCDMLIELFWLYSLVVCKVLC